MLIQRAEVNGRGPLDVRVEGGRVTAVGALLPFPREAVLNASGGALLPGLNDHHIHLMSYAASLTSVPCGPPQVHSENQLAVALGAAGSPAGDGLWIRGVGYHESVAGSIDRHWLDRHVPDTPVRVQHRSGRLWIVNSAGLERLRLLAGERAAITRWLDAGADGRLYDGDNTLRDLLGTTLPPVARASRQLAAFGVTGITDMTPGNDNATLQTFSNLQSDGALLQKVLLAGTPLLEPDGTEPTLRVGATKVHLHETALPPFQDLCRLISASHHRRRPVAVHCVTETELVFTLTAFREAGAGDGDRIEHASVTPPALLDDLRELGLTVVTQPNFVNERGDAYRTDIPSEEHPWLYRCRSFLERGIPLAGATDAPFGGADPWRAMAAAVTRRVPGDHTLGQEECLTPEQALDLFLGDLQTPARPRRIEPGMVADLCLLDSPWATARDALSCQRVRATLRGGELIYDRVDQTPLEGQIGFDTNA